MTPGDRPADGAATADAGAAHLRRFCRAVLGWLDAGGDRLPGVTRDLAGAVGAGAAAALAGLAREAAAYDAALAGLRGLGSARLLAPPPALGPVIADLAARRALADQVLAAMRQLSGPAAGALPSIPESESPLSASGRGVGGKGNASRRGEPDLSPPAPPPEAGRGEQAGPGSPALEHVHTGGAYDQSDPDTILDVPTFEDDTPDPARATILFERGAALQRAGDFAQAAMTYTCALEADPGHVPAWTRRGQVRLALEEVEAALVDFDTAVDLDPAAAEARWLRGDALVVAGRTDAAVADYEQALAINPGLARARFNLAVALRVRGDLDRALAEFDRVLRDRPGHAGAHLNRGLIHRHRGDAGRAAAEFRAALRSDPACEAARRHLDELERDRPAAIPAPAPEPPGRRPPGDVRRVPDRRDVGLLTVECPRCGETGEVPLDRLGKVFACPKCRGRVGLRADGSVVEVVATRDGKWVDRPTARGRARQRRRRGLAVAALIGVLLVPVIGLSGWRALKAGPAPAPAEPELPTELTARADQFGKAWAANDLRTLRRLAGPADERAVFPWYQKHAPPPALRTAADVRVEVSARTVRPGVSAVRLRVSNPRAPALPPADFTTQWQQRGDAWHFVPGPTGSRR